MSDLLRFDETPGGYRLDSFELYNWGCFNNRIDRIRPLGGFSLLTGANGSGKTTIVDALVTLLVPPSRRHYNQSSGAGRKRERTETSYVLGAYGTVREDESYGPVSMELRKRDTYSILLGLFTNKGLKKTVSLVQVRWFSREGITRKYFIINEPVSIKEHILPLDNRGEFRKRLQEKNRAEFFDSFQQYQLRFSRIFGFRSGKALNLFSQTVGVKVLGDLNEFIRRHMLEKPETETVFEQLYEHYQNLLNSHKQIEKARIQLLLLEPVKKLSGIFIKAQEERENAARAKEALPGLFALIKETSIRINMKLLEISLAEHETKKRSLLTQEEQLEELLHRYRLMLEQNETAHQVQEIDLNLRQAESSREERHSRFTTYDTNCKTLEFPSIRDEEGFFRNRKKAGRKEEELKKDIKNERDRNYLLKRDHEQTEQEREALASEIEFLSKRKSNIPMVNEEIRNRITRGISVDPGELPFAGELIQVKDTEADWENAIEKLLHNFALCLLVPEPLYQNVNRFAHEHDLQGRIVYFRVTTDAAALSPGVNAPGSVISKLSVKEDSPYREWILSHLNRNFDYLCTRDLKEFIHVKRALLVSGLIKGGGRHEKDDREKRKSRRYYVLGWDNRKKRRALLTRLTYIEENLEKKKRELSLSDKRIQNFQALISSLEQVLSLTLFSEIDWWGREKSIRELKRQKKVLLDSSKELTEIEKNIQETSTEKKRVRQEADRISHSIGAVTNQKTILGEKKAKNTEILKLYDRKELDPLLPALMKKAGLPAEPDDLSLIENKELCVRKELDENHARREEEYTKAEINLIKAMSGFINPSVQVVQEYPGWSTETAELVAAKESLHDFERLYERIRKDDLPQYQKRFREFLNHRIMDDMICFHESLYNGQREIEEGITELNHSLQKIIYNKVPETYIRLIADPTTDRIIRDFKALLKNSMPDAGVFAWGDEEEVEKTFLKIQKLIQKLKEDEIYRKRVLDVRYWLTFGAEEKYMEDHTQKQFYKDSQSLSGGEKAKLAYTILASAIAYQYNLDEDPDKSFRFVIIDEAFSKVDPENSSYALELFRNLDLQLMVVTPLDKINLVQDYVQTVHYTESKDGIEASVFDLTIEKYRYMKKENTEKEQHAWEPAGAG